jgi:hypothetical protein
MAKRKKMGRPALGSSEKRRHSVSFMANDREYDSVQEQADREGRTVADWLRRIAVPTVRA